MGKITSALSFPFQLIHSTRTIRRKAFYIAITALVLFGPFVVIALMNADWIFATFRGTSTAPVGYWRLDEGQGTTANDSSGNSNSGTISGATWQNQEMCVSNKCLQFDGNNDNIQRADDSDFDFGAGVSFSVSVWIKHSENTSGQDILISKFNEAGYKILMEADGDITCGLDYDSTWSPADSVTSTAANYDDNKWHQVTCVKDANTSLTLYIDGTSVGTPDSSLTNSTLTNSDPLYVGIDADGTSNPWLGHIDDFKIYNYALSASQVKADFNSGSSVLGAKTQSPLSNGLVGYWKLDESSGNASDSSGNSATLTNTGSTAFATGKFGNGADLESGSSNYFSATDTAPLSVTGDMTISGWIKPESVTASTQFDIVSKWNSTNKSYLLSQYGDEIRFYLNSSSNYVETTSTNLSTSTWYHVVAAYSASNQSVKIYVNGSDQAVTTTGTIPSSITDTTANFSIGSEVSISGSNLNLQVSSSADDADTHGNSVSDSTSWTGNATASTTTATTLGPGRHAVANGDTYSSGARFSNVTISQGATISSATFKLTPSTTYNSSPNVIKYHVSGENADNSSAFSTSVSMLNATNRPRTTSNCGPWTQSSITINVEESLDVTNCVQEIINRSGWTSGNALSIIIDTHSDTNDSEWQDYFSYDNTPSKAPKLDISYSTNTASNFYDGVIDDLRVYNRTLNAGDISQLYSSAPGPVGYWNFEEGSGTSANDSSGNANTGTLTNGPVWTAGKLGKGINFDGSNDHVLVADSSTLDFTAGSSFTVSGWMKHDTQSSGQDFIISKFASAGYKLYMESDGDITFGIDDDGTSFPEDSVTSTAATYDDNKWHYVVGVKDGNTSLRLYIDGVEVGTADTSISATGTLANADPFYIGIDEDGTSNAWLGQIDDVKVYNYARSPSQIVQDMNGGHPIGGSPVGSMIGYWKFDEGADNTCSGGSNDACNSGSSGSTLDGAITGALWNNTGKAGKSLTFDATDDRVVVKSSANLNGQTAGSISAWVYPTTMDSTQRAIYSEDISSGSVMHLKTVDSKFAFTIFNSGFSATDCPTSATYSTNSWYHLVATFNSSNGDINLYVNGKLACSDTTWDGTFASTINNVLIGDFTNAGTYGFGGKIDEVKTYNAELTASEIKTDYNQGRSLVLGALSTESDGTTPSNSADRYYCPPGDTTTTCAPIGYWNFEEGSGTSAYDKSGNGNTGTLTGNPLRAPGKIGNALTFNGSSNYVSGTGTSLDGASAGTISFWMKTSSATADDYVVSFPNISAGTNGFDVRTNTTSMNVFLKTSGSTADLSNSTTFADGKWHYITATYDGATLKSYWDGTLKSSSSITGTIDVQADNEFNFGRFGSFGGHFAGSIDEVKVYNYARSAAQVAWDYNFGKPVGWWKMDECSGTAINDSMGNIAAGTLTIGATGSEDTVGTCSTSSTAWGSGASGKRNYSLSFDGTDDYISIPHPTKLDVQDTFTLEAWVYPTSSVDGAGVIAEEFTGAGDRVQFELGFGLAPGGGTAPMVGFYTGSAWQTTADPTNITNSTWTHIAGTYDGTTLKIYTNGILKNSTAASGQGVDTNSIWIGRRHDTGGTVDYFPGQIDDVRIYNHARNAAQIRTDMNDGALRWGPATGAP